MELPRPASHRPLASTGYSVVEVTDDNLPVPQPTVPGPAGVPPPLAYRVVLVGEESIPTPPRPRSPDTLPDRTTAPADAPRPGRGLMVLALLVGGPVLLMWLALSAVPVVPRVRPSGGFASEHPPLPTIDPQTPVADLLPAAPKVNAAPVYLGDDLASVPELTLEAAPEGELTAQQWKSRKAQAAAVALHLNGKEEDGFLKTLVRARPDLSGIPFVMGGACRTEGERKVAFREAAEKLRREKEAAFLGERPLPGQADETRQHFWQAHTAVAAQVMPTESVERQLLLIRKLASIPRPEATRALARVAVFSPDGAVRAGAIEVLSVRRERDYTDVLLAGLRYPWPAAARNAAEAIVRLGRKDLAERLVALLDEPDPRGPRTEEVAGREVTVAPELVRINHLRNCLLCHAPAEPGKVPDGTLVAEVPVPSEALPETGNGYGSSVSNLLVRIDVTYLRQDFSAVLEAKERSAWPAMQRFDFVVRKRVLTPAESAELRERLEMREPDGLSPYQRAAAEALRGLTGRDFGGRAEPWRRLLQVKPS